MSTISKEEHKSVWLNAPLEAYHWERFPNGKCVWHCRSNGRVGIYIKKAPNFEVRARSIWRSEYQQMIADSIDYSLKAELDKRNIVLA